MTLPGFEDYRPGESRLNLSFYRDFTPERLAQLEYRLLDTLTPSYRSKPGYLIDLNFNDSYAAALFEMLGLGLYQNEYDDLLIGAADESLHPHERWLYQRPAALDTWYEMNHHAQAPVPGGGHNGISTIVNNVPARLRKIFEKTTTRSLRQNWQLNPIPNSLFHVMRQVLETTQLSPVELHDLLYHYDVWASRNPEFADMPQAIVQRMHGLGAIVDTGELR